MKLTLGTFSVFYFLNSWIVSVRRSIHGKVTLSVKITLFKNVFELIWSKIRVTNCKHFSLSEV